MIKIKDISLNLIPIVALLLTSSCSSGPEFERDNVNDPSSTYTNGIFTAPRNFTSRSRVADSSFTVKLTNNFIEEHGELMLLSNKDGVFYSTNEIDSRDFIVGRTELTKGVHTVYLVLDGIKTDSMQVNVDLPMPVNIKSVEWIGGGYQVSWEKFSDINFEAYKLYVISNNKRMLLAANNDINETTYIDYNYPVESNFRYEVQTITSDYEKNNETVSSVINPVLMHTYWAGYFRYPEGLEDIFYKKESGSLLYSYNIKRNEIDSRDIFGESYIYTYEIQNTSNAPVLVVAKKDKLDWYDLTDYSKLGSLNIGEVYELVYDKNLGIYFASRGYYTENFMLNLNSRTSKKYNNAGYVELGIDAGNKTLYGSKGYGYFSFHKINYDADGNFLTNKSIDFGFFTTESSDKANLSPQKKYISGKKNSFPENLYPTILKASTLNIHLELNYDRSIHGYTTYVFFYGENDRYVLMATEKGTLFHYDLEEKKLIGQYYYDYEISQIFKNNDQIYLLRRNSSLSGESAFAVSKFIPEN